jgi:tetratricopeptide (TPR) repeat protein
VALTLWPARAATNSPGTGTNSPAPDQRVQDPVEAEYEKLLEADDHAQAEVDRWIQENAAFAAKGGGASNAQLNQRIMERFEPVKRGYEDFLKRRPDHVRARIAYASFLGDIHQEDAARTQLEKALSLDTNNPAIYNNLANIYTHAGPVETAFDYYARAIELNPKEPVYYQNFADTVFLFRKNAMEHYHISENQVFEKAFGLFSNALRLDPTNFTLASDVAQTYYGVTPLPTEKALTAWTNTLSLARDRVELEGIHVHFARVKMLAGRYAEARSHLNVVTNQLYADLRKRLTRTIDEREAEAKGTNAPTATKPKE